MSTTPPPTLDNGRYIIERVLGAGGMSAVMLATDTRLGVQRAIKLLHRQFLQSDQLRTRFKNEAHAQAGLRHPNILMVHDVVEDDNGLYLVMELAEGGSLASRLASQGPLSPRAAATVGAEMARALAIAHDADVIHRDIKPDNVLFDKHGTLKIADFGIARVADRNPNLTRTGMIIGTWAFMPPEQRESARQTDGRADIYAIGATLYNIVTGQTSSALHNRETHARAFEGVPDALARVIIQCTRFEPDDRYPDCRALAADLEAIRDALTDEQLFAHTPLDPDQTEPLPLISDIIPTQPFGGLDANLTAVPAPEDIEPVEPPAETLAPVTQLHSDDRDSRSTYLIVGLSAALAATVGISLLGIGYILPHLTPDPPVVATSPDPTPEPVPDPLPVPEDPPTVDPVPLGEDPEPPTVAAEDAKPPVAAPSTPDPVPPKPRVITVIPRSGGGSAPDAPTADGGSDDAEVGTLVLRTVPSGASVTERGASVPRGGGGYRLGVGYHLLTVKSPTGEQTQLPVTIRSAGQVVEICYSFDTNGACSGPG